MITSVTEMTISLSWSVPVAVDEEIVYYQVSLYE